VVKILKFDEKDCLNFRFGVELISPVSELQIEEAEYKVPNYMGAKHVGYTTAKITCQGHAVLDIPYEKLIEKNVDWEREVTANFSSKTKPGLVLNNFSITQFKKNNDKTIVSFYCAPSK